MKAIRFVHFCGKDICSTAEEAKAVFGKAVNGTNAFHIYNKSNGLYPYANVYIHGEYAYMYYVPCDISFGIQAYCEDLDLDPDGITIFHINTPEEEMEIYNDYVVPKERALQVILALMDCEQWPVSLEELPSCVKWEEL